MFASEKDRPRDARFVLLAAMSALLMAHARRRHFHSAIAPYYFHNRMAENWNVYLAFAPGITSRHGNFPLGNRPDAEISNLVLTGETKCAKQNCATLKLWEHPLPLTRSRNRLLKNHQSFASEKLPIKRPDCRFHTKSALVISHDLLRDSRRDAWA
jgi:hypothetical protein